MTWSGSDGDVRVLWCRVLQNGDITSITYDEGCFFCDPLDDTVCVKDTFVPKSTGILNNDDYKGCVSSESDCNADSSSCDLNVCGGVWRGACGGGCGCEALG